MLPVVQKFLGRVFAHREQDCPSGKGSFPRKVNKVRKAGIHESRIPSTEPVSAYLEPATSPPHLYPGQYQANPRHANTQANPHRQSTEIAQIFGGITAR